MHKLGCNVVSLQARLAKEEVQTGTAKDRVDHFGKNRLGEVCF